MRRALALISTHLFLAALGAPGAYALDFFLSPQGSDGASGTSPSTAWATLEKAHSHLLALKPAESVRIRVAPGKYYCAGVLSTWTYVSPGGHLVTIEARDAVPSPAVSSANHASRPIFYGLNRDGTNCSKSIWLYLEHAKVPVNLIIKGIKIAHYRGGISVKGTSQEITRVDQNIQVLNTVFERIGDIYWRSSNAGKGAILLNYTFGNRFEDNYFFQIRNNYSTAGLIHPFYLSSASSRNSIIRNTIVGSSGSAIKVTHYSGINTILDNRFSYVAQAYTDRWCGSRTTPEDLECAATEPQCPSWNNTFDLSRNSIDHVFSSSSVVSDDPQDQVCQYPPPPNGIRLNLGQVSWGAAGGKVASPVSPNPLGRNDVCFESSMCNTDGSGVHTATLSFNDSETNCEDNIGANPTLVITCCFNGEIYRRSTPIQSP